MNLGEVFARFRFDAGDLGKVASVSKGLRDIGSEAKGAKAPVDSLGSSVQSLAMKAAAALGIYKLGDAMVSLVKESTMLSARVETLGVVMTTVGRNVGLNAQQMESYAQGVAQMGITTQASRDTVIRMTQAQMDLNQATKLARIAQDAAVIGNTNSSDALQKMIYGVQTGQLEVLKTIGLNVNFEESYKRLARQLGKNADDLTQLEKTQARTNVVIEAGTRIAGSYEAAMNTVGKQMNTMPRYIEEVKRQFGDLFKPALSAIVTSLTEALKNLDAWFKDPGNASRLKEWADRFEYLGKAVGGTVLAVEGLFERLSRIGTEPTTGEKQSALAAEFVENQRRIAEFGEKQGFFSKFLHGDVEVLKERNAEILKEFSLIGKMRRLQEETPAWEAFAGAPAPGKGYPEYPGVQKFDLGEPEGLTEKQRELQKKLAADIAKLQGDMFSEFAHEYAEREKIAVKDAKTLLLLNEWAAGETERIWKESDEKIADLKSKSEEAFVEANYKRLWDQRQAVEDAKYAVVKTHQEAVDAQNQSEEAFMIANYDRIMKQKMLLQELYEAGRAVRLQFASEYDEINKTMFEKERMQVARQVKVWQDADVDRQKISELSAAKLREISLRETVSRLEFYEKAAGGIASTFQKVAQAGGKYSEESFRIYQAFAIVEAGVSAAKAIVMALGSPPGPPYSWVTATITGALAATQIALIAAAKPPKSYDEGGVSRMPGTYYAGVPEAHIPLKSGRVPVQVTGDRQRGATFVVHMENPVFQDAETQRMVFAQIAAVIARQVAPDAVAMNYENDGAIRRMVRGRR